MAKLAPSPALPIDLLPIEKRQESTLLPNPTTLPERGPEIDRPLQRASLLASLNVTQTTPEASPNQPATAQTQSAPTQPPEPQSPSPRLAQPIREEAALSQETARTQKGFFSQLKDTFLEFTGLASTTKNPEPAAEKQGFLARVVNQFSRLSEVRSLSDLAAWAKGMVHAAAPRWCARVRPTPKIVTPQPLNIQPAPSYSAGEVYRSSPTTVIITAPAEEPLTLSDAKSKGPSLTELALNSVAAATQAQNEEKAQKESRKESDGTRSKESAQAALRRLQMEGLSAMDLAAISAELGGVYGTAEVALRNAQDLLTHKKRK